MEKSGKKRDIEERLIDFAVLIMNVAETLPKTMPGRYISDQLIRSGTSPALNYAEAKGAESRADFIHKMKICLKELRETNVALRIIRLKMMVVKTEILNDGLSESNELISIFVRSVQTAEGNRKLK